MSTSVKIPAATKTKIIDALRRGDSNEKIQKRFAGRYTRQQIAAFKAWITMGKY